MLSRTALFLIVAWLLPANAWADVLELSPERAVVLPDDGSGLTRIALAFDLSGMREGPGRQINQAILGWFLDGAPSDRTTSFAVHRITENWSPRDFADDRTSVRHEQDETDTWEWTPRDYARFDRGVVRMDLMEQVEAWCASSDENFGVLLVTDDVDRDALPAQLANAKLLVWYGFGPH